MIPTIVQCEEETEIESVVEDVMKDLLMLVYRRPTETRRTDNCRPLSIPNLTEERPLQ